MCTKRSVKYCIRLQVIIEKCAVYIFIADRPGTSCELTRETTEPLKQL